MNNLKQIGLGLHNYADFYQHLPAAFTVDGNQKPAHSWRLSIIWFSSSTGPGFVDPFRYDEPWNSRANLAISDRLGGLTWYCPSSPKSQPQTHANYVMPLGPHTISDGPNYITFDQISDGLSNTIAAGEIANSDIYWTEPRDLPLDSTNFRINDRSRPNFSSAHPGAALVVFADGGVGVLSDQIDPMVLKALLSIDGGESPAGRKP